MLPALAALAAGLSYSLLSFFSRMGMERTNAATATFISGGVSVLVFWAIFFATLPWQVLATMAILPWGPALPAPSLAAGCSSWPSSGWG